MIETDKLFTGDMRDLSRVNFWGIGMMLLGLLLYVTLGRKSIPMKIVSLLVVMVGTLFAVRFIG